MKKNIVDSNWIIDVNDENIKKILKKTKYIRKYCDFKKINVIYKYNDRELSINDLNKKQNEDVRDLITIMHAISIKDKMERYDYIYDTVCGYLDERIKTNYCEFKDNICVKYRKKNSNHENGCCECKGRGRCKYLIDGVCTMKSCMACKLFTCKTLKDMGITQDINDFALTKYFFTEKQKDILQFSYWTPKEIVMDRLKRNRRK